eukprot:TRINITY_DN1390_c0_g6_i1.p1 TRINITY_DN1390_c0_g6~~TRINITY_DN1390_c0_g6_i1.p1  ORF type:complete len:266 (+),score=67.39 TRINITY_DN1390_c0_g6_i1:33-800(+)
MGFTMTQGGRTDEIKHITMDISGTLINLNGEVGEVYCKIARNVAGGKWEVPADEVLQAKFIEAIVQTGFVKHPCFGHAEGMCARQWWEAVVRDAFTRCGWTFPTEVDFQKTFMRIYQHYATPAAFSVTDDVLPFLRWAQENNVSIGAVSNNTDRIVTDTLPMLGLHEYFSFFVTSHVLGHAKPSASIFAEGIKYAGVPAENILHIGDTFDNDYKGARDAGMKALHLDRSGNLPEDPEAHPFTVASLSQVVGKISG